MNARTSDWSLWEIRNPGKLSKVIFQWKKGGTQLSAREMSMHNLRWGESSRVQLSVSNSASQRKRVCNRCIFLVNDVAWIKN